MSVGFDDDRCLLFWGGHACDKPSGHVEAGDPDHVCAWDDPDGFCTTARATGEGDECEVWYHRADGSTSEPYLNRLYR